MYLKKFEYFILDSSVAGTLLLMALAIRIEAINAGFDQFSSNIIFISVFIISTGLYISMQIALYEIIIYLCHHSKSLSIHEHLNDSVIAQEQTFMEYEKLRSNTITEQKRTNDKKLELVHIYIHQTMAAYTNAEFTDISIESLPIDNYVLPYIEARISEIRTCLSAKAALSVIFLSGSTLEGVLLGLAQNNPAIYNQAKSAPKDNKTGRTRQFHEWTLSNLIDVSCEVGFLREDVKKFSHALRDFRNYIHPFQQMSEHFYPDDYTARICFQVLKAALFQITQNKKI